MKNITLILFVIFNLQIATSSAQQNQIDSLKQVIATAEQDTNQVRALYTLADIYQRINLDTSLIYAEQSLELALQLNYKIGTAMAYSNIGFIYVYQSNYDKTLKYWQKAIKIFEELGNKERMASALGNIGIVYRGQSNYLKALEYNIKALKIHEEIGFKPGIAANLGSIGSVYKDQGDYPKSLEYYQKSLKINEEIERKSGIAKDIGNIGIIYAEQNNNSKALEYYFKALNINKEIGDKVEIAINFLNIGVIYKDQGNYPKSLEYYQKSLKIAKELGNKLGIAINLGNIGSIYFVQSNYSKALEYYQEALVIEEEIGSKSGIARHLGNIGSLYNDLKQYNKALDYNKKALKKYQEIGVAKTDQYQNLSTSYWALNNKNKAANNLDTVLNINNKNILLNFSILPENAKQLYFAGVETDYWKYNSFVLQNTDSFPNMVETVYNNTVKNKGLLLKSNTAMRNAIQSSKDSTLVQDYDNWIVLKRQIVKKYSNGEDATVLENKADSLEGYLVKNSNEFSDFKKTQNISWQQVQASLKENELAIEFTHFPLLNPDSSYIEFTNQTQYVALILTKNSKPQMIPLFEEKQLEQIIGKFGGNNYSYINSIYGKNTEVNKELYNLVWAPIDSFLTTQSQGATQSRTPTKIFISPSGLLHKISFSAIAKEQNVYLCDAYNIEVKSSTGKITESKKALSSGNA